MSAYLKILKVIIPKREIGGYGNCVREPESVQSAYRSQSCNSRGHHTRRSLSSRKLRAGIHRGLLNAVAPGVTICRLAECATHGYHGLTIQTSHDTEHPMVTRPTAAIHERHEYAGGGVLIDSDDLPDRIPIEML